MIRQNNCLRAITGVLFLIVAAVLGNSSSAEEAKKLPLAVAMFNDIPKGIEDVISKGNFDNKLRAAASRSIVFEILPGNVFTKGAIAEAGDLAGKLYGGKTAEYFLVNCAISGKPDSLTATGLLVTVKDNDLEEIGTVVAAANNVDQLMSRFWQNVDRPIEAFQTAPDLDGRWKFESGHDPEAEKDFIVELHGNPIAVSLWDYKANAWRKPAFNLSWNPAGYFEGSFWDSKNAAHQVNVRISRGEGGRREMAIKGDGLDMRATNQASNIDEMQWTWQTEQIPAVTADEDTRSEAEKQNSGQFAKSVADMLTFPKTTRDTVKVVWQGADRATISAANIGVDWSTIEVFIIDQKWHMYFMKKNAKGKMDLFDREVFTPFMSPVINQSNTKRLSQESPGMIYWGIVSLPVRPLTGNPAMMLKERLWYGSVNENEPGREDLNLQW